MPMYREGEQTMKIRKRLLAAILTLVLIISMLPLSTFADDGTNNNSTHSISVNYDPIYLGEVPYGQYTIPGGGVRVSNEIGQDVTIQSISFSDDRFEENYILDKNSWLVELPYTLTGENSIYVAVGAKSGLNLPVGDHNGTMMINYNDGTADKTLSVDLSLTITAISLDRTTVDFFKVQDGYDAITPRSVLVFNAIDQDVTITSIGGAVNFDVVDQNSNPITQPLVVPAKGRISFWVKPKDGLPPDRYDETLTITYKYDSNLPEKTMPVRLMFYVTPIVPMEVSVSPESMNFGSARDGYAALSSQEIKVTNGTPREVTIKSISSVTNYDVTPKGSDTLLSDGGVKSIYIKPKDGLRPGTYNETLTITYNDGGIENETLSVNLLFTVKSVEVGVSPISLDFGSVQADYDAITSQEIKVTNGTSREVTIKSIGGATHYDVTPKGSDVLVPDEGVKSIFIKPKDGLEPETYNETLTITYNDGDAVDKTMSVKLRFNVSPVMQTEVSVSPGIPDFGLVQVDYDAISSQEITVTNGGTSVVTIRSIEGAGNYDVVDLQYPFPLLAGGSSFSFRVKPKNGLVAGTYNEQLKITYEERGMPGNKYLYVKLRFAVVEQLPKHTVTLTSNPDGACSFEGAGDYDEGTEATVKAAHTTDYVFDGWYDEAGNKVSDGVREGTSSTYAYTFTVSEDVKLTAKFKKLTSLSYAVAPLGNNIFAPDEEFRIRYFLMDSQDGLLRSEFDKITLSLNGKSIGENQSGRSSFIVKGSDLNLGSNELTLVYPGNDVYHRASGIIKVNIVNKLQPRLVDFEPTYAPLNTSFTISGRLLDENNNPVIGEHMTLSIQQSETSAGYINFAWITTDDEGRFSCTCDKKLPDSPGKRKIHIYTDGNDKYKYFEAYPEVQFTDKEIYSITSNVEPKEGGMVTLSKSSTIAGDEVTIGVTPNKGYVFDNISCPVDIIPLGSGNPVTSWKFTMPESDVNISAFFKKSTETEEGEDPVDPVEVWNVKLDMNGGTIWEAETDAIKSSISMECPSGYEQEVPTIEWMKEALEEGTWITGPAECEYIGAEITDKNGKAFYQPGDIYKVFSDALIKVLWKSTKEENTSPGKSYISYDLNGGMLNGKTGKVVIEGTNGTTIILPEPTREGYIFDYWEGSRYNAGDEYVINGDHTLTAHWKKASAAPGEDEEDEGSSGEGDEGNAPEDTTPKPGEGENNGDSNQGGTPGDAKGDTNKSEANRNNRNNDVPPTGDENRLILWLTLSIVLLMGCVLIAREARK